MKTIYTFLFACSFIALQPSFSQTWNGSISSDWNTAANWTPNTVPGPAGNVIISNAMATYQPVLGGNVNISALNMSAGILNLASFTLTCSGHVTLTGGSLLNGHLTALTFDNVAGMQMGGKVILEKTGTSNAFWTGNNKFYGDSLVIVWRAGALHLQNAGSSPDSIFGSLKVLLADNYSVYFAINSSIYVQNNLVLDDVGNGVFYLNGSGDIVIGGNLVAENFSNTVPNFPLSNLTALGVDANGPFHCHAASIDNCKFNGNFTLVADSNVSINIHNSSFLGSDNLLQAGNLDAYGNRFGRPGNGTTILRAAHSLASGVLVRTGDNKFFGDAQWETYAAAPGAITMQHNWYGPDSSFQNLGFILKGNSALSTNNNGHNYVAGNVSIDGQGTRKWIEFLGGTGSDFNIRGNFIVKNFTPSSEAGVTLTKVILHNVTASGSDTCGTFYCTTGDINYCSFNGNFGLIADSSQAYFVNNSFFLGADNSLQAGIVEVQNSKFGQVGQGTTILRSALSSGSNYMRDGNNKFFNNVRWEPYAASPNSVVIQQNFYGADSCLGNMSYILKGNSALTTNGGGNNYVAGDVTIDGQGARKWIQFSGGAGNSFNVRGNFTVKNFTPFSEPGVGVTNVYLHNLYVTGSDTVGTIYCYTGDIQYSSFNGNLKVIADSSQGFSLYQSALLGTDNFFQAGNIDVNTCSLGHAAAGATVLKSAHNLNYGTLMRDGNNKFFGDIQWIAVPPPNGSILIQQTFHGPDTCLGNVTINLSGAASASLGGNNLYIGKGLAIQNNGSGVVVHNTGGTAIRFVGSDTANYSFSGSGSVPSILNIEMNRRGGLRLMSPLSYTGTLTLTRGIILSSPSNPLQIPNGAVVNSGWDSGYVDGPLMKTGNTAFTFPLGRKNIYAPLSITAPSLTTDAFTAQYFNHLAHNDGYDSTQHDVSLNHLSRKEYWKLDRTAGTSSVGVTLSWKISRSGTVNAMNDLRVAHWNGTIWKDEGNGGTTGTNTEGTIQSLSTISSFSPFTLGSSGLTNPLPVTFISFDVQLNANRTVLIKWKTGDEIDNDHFEVQRSFDGTKWASLTSVRPNSAHVYDYTDALPQQGVNYYRIKGVDIGAKYSYTRIKSIKIRKDTELFIWPNPATSELHVQLPFVNGSVEIIDVAGRTVMTRIVTSGNIVIPMAQLKAGVYVLKAKNGHEICFERFLKE